MFLYYMIDVLVVKFKEVYFVLGLDVWVLYIGFLVIES